MDNKDNNSDDSDDDDDEDDNKMSSSKAKAPSVIQGGQMVWEKNSLSFQAFPEP